MKHNPQESFALFTIVAQYKDKWGNWINIRDNSCYHHRKILLDYNEGMEYISQKKSEYEPGTEFRVVKITETTTVVELEK